MHKALTSLEVLERIKNTSSDSYISFGNIWESDVRDTSPAMLDLHPVDSIMVEKNRWGTSVFTSRWRKNRWGLWETYEVSARDDTMPDHLESQKIWIKPKVIPKPSTYNPLVFIPGI